MRIADFKEEFELAKLIAKSRLTIISTEEQKALDRLLADSTKTPKILNRFNVAKFKTRQHLASSLDTHKSYRRVLKRIKTYETSKTTFKKYYQYAAILIVAIGIGSGILFVTRNQTEKTANQITDIAPGSQKAILVLGNGKRVALEDHLDVLIEQDSSIQNFNNTLVYSTSKSSSNDSYNTLLVPRGGVYNLTLADGTRVWLNSESSLYYPIAFNGTTREVVLKGEAYFEVAKNPEKPFIVNTAFTDIEVLGTKFNVNAYVDDPDNTVTLTEGKVQLTNFDINTAIGPVFLTPGKQATVNKETKSAVVNDVNTSIALAWKDGKFYFEKAPIDQILTRMARWYDFEFSFKDTDLNKIRFTGVIDKNKTLNQLLDIIKQTSNINYSLTKINSNRYELTITKK